MTAPATKKRPQAEGERSGRRQEEPGQEVGTLPAGDDGRDGVDDQEGDECQVEEAGLGSQKCEDRALLSSR